MKETRVLRNMKARWLHLDLEVVVDCIGVQLKALVNHFELVAVGKVEAPAVLTLALYVSTIYTTSILMSIVV